jgi:hypothetical protein
MCMEEVGESSGQSRALWQKPFCHLSAFCGSFPKPMLPVFQALGLHSKLSYWIPQIILLLFKKESFYFVSQKSLAYVNKKAMASKLLGLIRITKSTQQFSSLETEQCLSIVLKANSGSNGSYVQGRTGNGVLM